MSDLFRGVESGADAQSEAVRAYLQNHPGIEASYSTENLGFEASPKIGRWENCREQGYVVTMRGKIGSSRQLNIAFFEHRNSDEICAVMWEQLTVNSPTIETAKFGDVYKTKHDVSHRTRCGEAMLMADWIYEQLENFWIASSKGKQS